MHTQIEVERKYLMEAEEVVDAGLEKKKSSAGEKDKEKSEGESEDESEGVDSVSTEDIEEGSVFRKLLKLSRASLSWVVTGAVASLVNGGIAPIFSIAFGNILSLLNDVTAN